VPPWRYGAIGRRVRRRVLLQKTKALPFFKRKLPNLLVFIYGCGTPKEKTVIRFLRLILENPFSKWVRDYILKAFILRK